MGVRELVGDANGVPASEKVKKHWSKLLIMLNSNTKSFIFRIFQTVFKILKRGFQLRYLVSHLFSIICNDFNSFCFCC